MESKQELEDRRFRVSNLDDYENSVILLGGEETEAIPNNVWDDLVDKAGCLDLKLIEVSHREYKPTLRKRVGVHVRETIKYEHNNWRTRYGRDACDTYPYEAYVKCTNILVEANRRWPDSCIHSTMVVYHSEEWINANIEMIHRVTTRLRLYQCLSNGDVVRRYDLEPKEE